MPTNVCIIGNTGIVIGWMVAVWVKFRGVGGGCTRPTVRIVSYRAGTSILLASSLGSKNMSSNSKATRTGEFFSFRSNPNDV